VSKAGIAIQPRELSAAALLRPNHHVRAVEEKFTKAICRVCLFSGTSDVVFIDVQVGSSAPHFREHAWYVGVASAGAS
jgi:hypothetical protein